MGVNALGITDTDELAKIAKEVPVEVRREWCGYCLWASAECQRGSLYGINEDDAKVCRAYSFYD